MVNKILPLSRVWPCEGQEEATAAAEGNDYAHVQDNRACDFVDLALQSGTCTNTVVDTRLPFTSTMFFL